MILSEVIAHIRDRDYMSGVERDTARIKSTGEVFTPSQLVIEILDRLIANRPDFFDNIDHTFLDPSCGDGQILGEVLIKKLETAVAKDPTSNFDSLFERALGSVYGVEYQKDNVIECRERLLCGRNDLRKLVRTNIVCHDALTYDYSFNGTDLTQNEYLLTSVA